MNDLLGEPRSPHQRGVNKSCLQQTVDQECGGDYYSYNNWAQSPFGSQTVTLPKGSLWLFEKGKFCLFW